MSIFPTKGSLKICFRFANGYVGVLDVSSRMLTQFGKYLEIAHGPRVWSNGDLFFFVYTSVKSLFILDHHIAMFQALSTQLYSVR